MKPKEDPMPNDLLEHLLDAQKLKNCFECGICTGSCPMNELLPNDYNPRILMEKICHNPEEVLNDPALWMCAWCYRCYKHCPQKVRLPDVLLTVRKIAKEQGKLKAFDKAMEIVSQTVPLPVSFSLVCLHPERAQIDDSPDQVFKHSAIKRRKTGSAAQVQKAAVQRVAVIGAGPAGLTAAYELGKKGYEVTVFESAPQPGGMLKQCIPEFRLPKKILDEEISHIKDAGVEIKTNTKIGKDLNINDLRKQGFNAILLSVGAHKTRKLVVEGEDLPEVFDALGFLRKTNSSEQIEVGQQVTIIGGGNVAIDSARTAKRLGAKEVTILYRRTKDEMPANPYEIQETEGEGVKIQFLVAPKRILDQNGHVHGIECLKMKLGEPDQTGRRAPVPIEGSEFTIRTDSVILAIGEAPDLSAFSKEIEIGEGNTMTVEPYSNETTQPGIFAAGDCVSGPATFIEAIVAGKKAAESIHQYLQGGRAAKTEQILEGRSQT